MATRAKSGQERRAATGLRADARRNHTTILAAAQQVFLAQGAGAALDEVARVAGVGIGTVYRRFGDRDGLLRAVVLEALANSYDAATSAGEEADSGLEALERYMHDALDLRVSAIIPLALDRLDPDDTELTAARERSAGSFENLIRRAHDDGSLAAAVTFADLGTMLVRLARPLPGPMTAELDDDLAHRHLELVLAGLRTGGPDSLERGRSRAELRGDRTD